MCAGRAFQQRWCDWDYQLAGNGQSMQSSALSVLSAIRLRATKPYHRLPSLTVQSTRASSAGRAADAFGWLTMATTTKRLPLGVWT